jgi:hypothetical protein
MSAMGMRRCLACGKERPLRDFVLGRSWCAACEALIRWPRKERRTGQRPKCAPYWERYPSSVCEPRYSRHPYILCEPLEHRHPSLQCEPL